MKGNRLPNKFFKENPLLDNSAAMLMYWSVDGEFWSILCRELFDTLEDPERKKKIEETHDRIARTEDPAELVEIMRKGYDNFNQQQLCEKVLEKQEETMPLVLKRFRTCSLDLFIEAAAVVLARGDLKYAIQLREMYQDIRCPYARACACLIFGIQGMDGEIPFLVEEYERFCEEGFEQSISEDDEEDTSRDYEEFPLLALYILHGKW